MPEKTTTTTANERYQAPPKDEKPTSDNMDIFHERKLEGLDRRTDRQTNTHSQWFIQVAD